MKQLMYSFTILMILFTGCVTSRHVQRNAVHYSYIPFRDFKGDTAAYLQHIESNRQYFIGKPFKVLLDSIGLPVIFCKLSKNFYKVNGRGVDGQGDFYFCNYEAFYGKHALEKKENVFSINVIFDPPYADDDTMIAMMRRHDGRWWNEESRKILEQLIVTDFQYSNWDVPIYIGKDKVIKSK